MFSRHRLAEVAALLGDPARAAIVTALWDGRARPAGELAKIAGVTPATASSHLGKLVAGGLLRVEPRGRHRDYRLASAPVAHALEALAGLVPPRATRQAGGGEAAGPASTLQPIPPIRRARLCYDHVAGQLGVALSDALVARRLLALRGGAYALPAAGRRWFARFGIAVEALEAGRRPLLRACTDWTERREHMGGALGAALAAHLLERDWLRHERGARTLLVTSAGRQGLARSLGLRAP